MASLPHTPLTTHISASKKLKDCEEFVRLLRRFSEPRNSSGARSTQVTTPHPLTWCIGLANRLSGRCQNGTCAEKLARSPATDSPHAFLHLSYGLPTCSVLPSLTRHPQDPTVNWPLVVLYPQHSQLDVIQVSPQTRGTSMWADHSLGRQCGDNARDAPRRDVPRR
jgi:hypothetical protein